MNKSSFEWKFRLRQRAIVGRNVFFQVLIFFNFYFQSLSSHTLGRQLSQFSYMEEEEETAIEFKENISEITKEAEGTTNTGLIPLLMDY